MKVALLGASGHVGFPTLLEFLKIEEIECIKVLLEKKYPRNKLVEKTAKKNPNRIEIYYGDVANKEDVLNVVQGTSYLFNLSGVIPPRSDKHPDQSYLANEVGINNIVEVLEAHPDIRFVDISTMALYGGREPSYPFLRVGDPLFGGVYDFYTTHKMRGEFKILESNIPYFTIIRQTAMIYRDMLTSNMNDGLIFHTPFNGPLEWSTDDDTARLFACIIKEDLKGKLNYDNFWRKVFNLGGGDESRVTSFHVLQSGFDLFGKDAKKIYEPNYNVTRNFHGGFFVDGDKLNDLFHYREDTLDGYWPKVLKAHPELKGAKIVPSKMMKKFAIERVFKDDNAPRYWYNHHDEARLIAFYGGKEKYEKLPHSWDGYEFWDYKAHQNLKDYQPRDYGFDIEKSDKDITIEDLRNVAKKHGGKLITSSFKTGDVYQAVEWENSDGVRFMARPFTVLRGGHWINPIYKEFVWDFDRLAKKDEIYAQYWYDSHDKEENNFYYFDEKLEAKIR